MNRVHINTLLHLKRPIHFPEYQVLPVVSGEHTPTAHRASLAHSLHHACTHSGVSLSRCPSLSKIRPQKMQDPTCSHGHNTHTHALVRHTHSYALVCIFLFFLFSLSSIALARLYLLHGLDGVEALDIQSNEERQDSCTQRRESKNGKKVTQCRVWQRRFGIESRSTNQNCPFRTSHRPTRRLSDLAAIL